jgi:PIN domain nuclease of toxin-antitoxin system
LRVLLDTHALLWFVSDLDKLRVEARELIEDAGNDVFVSVVSAWEVAIKQSVGKLDLPEPAEMWVPKVLKGSGLEVLDIDLRSTLRTRALPFHHRDPFDRLLVAQSLEHGLTFCSRDAHFHAYGIPMIEA